MRLNHLDLPVPDVAETRAFFERYLGFTHERTLGQDGLSILRDEAGLLLVLSKGGSFHIGFHLESEQAVRALYDKLAEDGKAGAPPVHQRGAFSFYFTAPGGILVEIAHR
ncbi:MAG TPA: VOC family protein [Magnetospirillaceae bacterium]|nr:VOC family protein [Magnetospirillaceae bacterium]